MFPIALSSKHSVCLADGPRTGTAWRYYLCTPTRGPIIGGVAISPIFWAAIPVLAAMIALFLLRDQNRLLPIDVTRGAS
jgi:hypothetical protein